MWDETSDSLTRISVGSGGAGDTDGCVATWTPLCSVRVAQGFAGAGDYPIAVDNGDVYFYSPELLDGPANGLEGGQNLYVYRNGGVHYVAALKSNGSAPLTRIQVAPDGEHAAFVTRSKLTSYDNVDHAEMYSYDPGVGGIRCVSCLPNGDPPVADVTGSGSGFFMSNDGRTFFSTPDPLVPQDTNGLTDVYEFVEGRPQLITAGTGAADTRHGESPAGLEAVSADGVNVYFSTYDTLVEQDHNGQFLKFYDARTGGGFPSPQFSPPCAAADECHGASSSAPTPALVVSGADLGSGGNAVTTHRRRKKHQRRHRHHKKSPHSSHHTHHVNSGGKR
jgi:hypothetical protein